MSTVFIAVQYIVVVRYTGRLKMINVWMYVFVEVFMCYWILEFPWDFMTIC